MERHAALPHVTSREQDLRVRLLLADADARIRWLLASCARRCFAGITVLEAEDGAEAVQLGLQRRPQIALLDIEMPKLGGIEVALTLRELQPRMHLALQTVEPRTHRDRARENDFLLFDKLELNRALGWLERQVQLCAVRRLEPSVSQKHALECSSCGYGITRSTPPRQCPMCQAEDAWVHTAWRPFRGATTSAL
jgi:CheY-like chemotaxis protein